MQAALVGVTGYAGMILYQLLKKHPNVNKVNIYSHSIEQPTALSSLVESFVDDDRQVLPYDPHSVMENNDVVFFATSAGVTSKIAEPFINANFPVIDLSGDFRLKNPKSYAKWYKKTPADANDLKQADYGLADFNNAKGSHYIANPGCYATPTLIGLAPLVIEGLVDEKSIVVDAKSGTSGAGKKLSESTHFSNTNDNLQIYKANQHQHIPEIVQQLQQWNSKIPFIEFMTTLLPVTRGIMATIYAKVKPGIDSEQITGAYKKTYQDKQFIRFFDDKLPVLKEVVGTNYCDVGTVFNETTQTVTVVSVIDNLIKGAAGQAVQNFNEMFGYDKSAGLKLDPVLL